MRSNRIRLALLAVIGCAILMLPCLAQSVDIIAITGMVTSATGDPIPGAHVEWGEPVYALTSGTLPLQTTTTDASGRFRILTAPSLGGKRLGVRAPGFAASWSDHLPAPEHDIIQRDFQLAPAHFISGVVVDDTGTTLSGVQVTVRTPESEYIAMFEGWRPLTVGRMPGPVGVSETTTGPDGRFRFDNLPDGKVQLSFDTPYRHINSRNYPVDQHHRIVMRGSGQSGQIDGYVIDATTGQPVPEFTLVLRYHAEPLYFSDLDGLFTLLDLQAASSYEIHMYVPGYAAWHGKLTASFGGDPQLQVVKLVPKPPMTVRVCTADRRFVVGAQIIAADFANARYIEWGDLDRTVDGHHPTTHVQRAVTDEHGIARFACEDTLTSVGLIIYVDGYAREVIHPRKQPKNLPDDEWNIVLQPEAAVIGRFVKSAGSPASVDVSVYRLLETRTWPEENYESFSTNETGAFRCDKLPPGQYYFHVWDRVAHDTIKSRKLHEFTLSAGQTLDLGEMVYDINDAKKSQ